NPPPLPGCAQRLGFMSDCIGGVCGAVCNRAVTVVREDDGVLAALSSAGLPGMHWPLRMNRYGYSIFCDDIRNEAGGKLSFIGCYNGVIFISGQFPLVLPKLCVHTHILSPASQPFNSIAVRCYLPGDEKPSFEEPIETPVQHDQN